MIECPESSPSACSAPKGKKLKEIRKQYPIAYGNVVQ